MEYSIILLIISANSFLCDAIFFDSINSNRTTTTRKPYTVNTNILDPIAASICPQHLPRTKTLMYNTYTKHCFQINNDKKADWPTAKADCESRGGYLAVIEGFSDNSFIGFRAHGALQYHEDEHMWIGLSDKDTEGIYKWTNGAHVQYPTWADGEPNGGTSQNCVAYNRESDKFEDWECSHPYAWICQYDLNAKPILTVPSTINSLITKPLSLSSTVQKLTTASTLHSSPRSESATSTRTSTENLSLKPEAGECPSCTFERNISRCSATSTNCRGSEACFLEFTKQGASAGCSKSIIECYRIMRHTDPACRYRPIPFKNNTDLRCAYCCDISKESCFTEFLSLAIYERTDLHPFGR